MYFTQTKEFGWAYVCVHFRLVEKRKGEKE